jgi:hypothetical protein
MTDFLIIHCIFLGKSKKNEEMRHKKNRKREEEELCNVPHNSVNFLISQTGISSSF